MSTCNTTAKGTWWGSKEGGDTVDSEDRRSAKFQRAEGSRRRTNPTPTLGPCAFVCRRRPHGGRGTRSRACTSRSRPLSPPAPSPHPQALALPFALPYPELCHRASPVPCRGPSSAACRHAIPRARNRPRRASSRLLDRCASRSRWPTFRPLASRRPEGPEGRGDLRFGCAVAQEDQALRCHVGRPLLLRPGRPFPPSSPCSLGWLRRQDSFRSSERLSLLSLSFRCFSASSREDLPRLSRSSPRLLPSVMFSLPLHLRWTAHPLRRPPICLAPPPMSPAQRTPDPRPPDPRPPDL